MSNDDLNLTDLDDDDMAAAMAKDEPEEVYADDGKGQITARELEAVYDIPVQV